MEGRGYHRVSIGICVCVHRAITISLITSGRSMLHQIFLYDREARQMPEMIKQKALKLEPILGSYGACKFSHTFLMEKPLTTTLPSKHIYDVYVVTTHQYIISVT